jgi:hypothetical protein
LELSNEELDEFDKPSRSTASCMPGSKEVQWRDERGFALGYPDARGVR